MGGWEGRGSASRDLTDAGTSTQGRADIFPTCQESQRAAPAGSPRCGWVGSVSSPVWQEVLVGWGQRVPSCLQTGCLSPASTLWLWLVLVALRPALGAAVSPVPPSFWVLPALPQALLRGARAWVAVARLSRCHRGCGCWGAAALRLNHSSAAGMPRAQGSSEFSRN